MTSYVNKGVRVFNEADLDYEVLRNRSESRMKKYNSACDVRVWCDSVEDRRQFFIENVEKDIQGYRKKLPLSALFDGGSSADAGDNSDERKKLLEEIELLQKQIDAYRQLPYTSEQQAQIDRMIKEQGLTDLVEELD